MMKVNSIPTSQPSPDETLMLKEDHLFHMEQEMRGLLQSEIFRAKRQAHQWHEYEPQGEWTEITITPFMSQYGITASQIALWAKREYIMHYHGVVIVKGRWTGGRTHKWKCSECGFEGVTPRATKHHITSNHVE